MMLSDLRNVQLDYDYPANGHCWKNGVHQNFMIENEVTRLRWGCSKGSTLQWESEQLMPHYLFMNLMTNLPVFSSPNW